MKKMLISGAYGTGNLGDEYILKQLENIFGQRFEITVLSQFPEYTKKHFPSINVIQQTPPFRFKSIIKDLLMFNWQSITDRCIYVKCLLQTDIFLLGGGGLLVEMIPRVLRFYLFQLSLANLLQKRCIVFGVGVGVIKTNRSKISVKKILNKIPHIYVRDDYSIQTLKQLGVLHVIKMPDLVYGLFEGISSREKTYKIGINVYRPFVVGTVADSGDLRLKNYEDSLYELLLFVKSESLSIEFFSFGSIYDEQYANDLVQKWPELEATIIKVEYKEQLDIYDYTITMRFHAGVTSLMRGVPSLCIDGQFKSERLLKEMDLLPLVVPLTDGINRQGRRDLSGKEMIGQFCWMKSHCDEVVEKSNKYFKEQKKLLQAIQDEVINFL